MSRGPVLTAFFPIFLAFLTALTTPRVALPQPPFSEVSKLPSRPELPNPLVMFDGTPVKTPEQWHDKRCPELQALIQHYVYGFVPPAPEKLEWKVEREDRKAFDGKATHREVSVSFGPPETPKIHLLLVVPNERKRPAPTFVGMSFCGNHALVKDPAVLNSAGERPFHAVEWSDFKGDAWSNI